MNNSPIVALGTMCFGGQTTEDEAKKQVQKIIDFYAPEKAILVCVGGYYPMALTKKIINFLQDTARLYQKGETEHVIGRLFKANPELRDRVLIHSKCDPSISKFTPSGIREQVTKSLSALGVSHLDVLYLHQPDISVDLLETLKVCNELHGEGKFKELGLSNYPSWEVVRIHYLCQEHNYVTPTIYQGVYHALSRSMEYELIPALRTLPNMRLHVFSPLCGGLLTGRYLDVDETFTEGRFSPEYHNYHLYKQRYFHKEIFAAIHLLRDACQQENETMASASLRWLLYHSYLRKNDALVLGTGRHTKYLDDNLVAVKQGPLSPKLIEAFEVMANIVNNSKQAEYFRGYGTQHGRSDLYLKKISEANDDDDNNVSKKKVKC